MKTYSGIFILLSFVISAQTNIIPNNSFEQIDTCAPPIQDPSHLIYWEVGNNGTTDLFIDCSPWGGGPVNFAGFQYPKNGISYVGIVTFAYGMTSNYREYIQAPLLTELEAGKKYYIGFWCSLAEKLSHKACNKLGAWLSDTVYAPSTYGTGVINEIPQLMNDTNVILDDTSSTWMLIADTITATGGEKYITIGNFFDDANSYITNTGINYPTSDSSSYYYIDDVFVYCVDVACDTTWLGNQSAPKHDFDFKVFPNPGNGEFKLEYEFENKDQVMFEVFDVSGRIVFSKKLSGQKFSENLNLQHLGRGLYFYSVSVKVGKNISGKLIIY
jgi:hypothetical protein